ncbi:MAG: ABC transporter ATP-binding protein [Microbacterium sp.]|uniref:ABC transporter ATP-binding protein n=1 Tax=Microbacterium sp. TaxID=51671 RepID=UPI003A88A25D
MTPIETTAGKIRADHALTVENLTKDFGDKHVLGGLDLTVQPGEFVCIVGPSGAGKTTLLRCLSGLMGPTAGTVKYGDRNVDRPLADIAVVFQDYRGSLMPWMRVWDNVAFPLQSNGVRKQERRERAVRALESVGLGDVADQYPWQLSGGMQQRVAIARALAYDAPILLMDEPFGSVDAQTRFELEDLIRQLRTDLGLTITLVTHDIDEAVYLSDRVVVVAGTPTRVIDEIPVDLGAERDQIGTKASPRFGELRSRVMREIIDPRFRDERTEKTDA